MEKFVKARKLEAAVMGFDEPVSSYVGEILNIDKGYDPLEVNTSTGDNLRIPADISDEMMQLVRETAVTAYKALGCRGYARVDFFLTENGELLVNKIGTAPGLRCNSVFPKLMEHYGISMPDLMDKLLEQAIENADRYY